MANDTPQYGCSPVNLLHIFRTPFSKNTSGGLLLCDKGRPNRVQHDAQGKSEAFKIHQTARSTKS